MSVDEDKNIGIKDADRETEQGQRAETLEGIARRYVADLPPTTDCAFNVAKKGQHRFCSRMGRKPIGGYCFCQRHADVVAKAVLESVGQGY